ncbi:tetratricopeptide repeat protein [Chondrinema litorale]|uniref:tetratricopeptide repeat protein n=1 Tax=Chondrinema litorale TaxID=2994555 RepID=UPI00254385CB|nr:hypothetical protein [Chondrinema litorale]UZR99305.1 hypothetical protein OQ292_36170 [Chondrinema litorale]
MDRLKNLNYQRIQFILLYLFILASIISCNQSNSPELRAPLFDNLGEHSLKISTKSDLAQKLFNQGLNLTYGFNHDEAARAFREAARIDSTCAMCYWGVAYTLGPNINAAMDDANLKEVKTSIEKAKKFKNIASDWEKALIEATAKRYDYNKTEDRSILDVDYANAMAQVHKDFPENSDIASLYAESLMDLHPWDLYEHDGSAKPWTQPIVDVLEQTLKNVPKHPLANHLYIHSIEASSEPERGLQSANVISELMPGAGHMVHMPCHIYIKTGHYHEGTVINERAAFADSVYLATCDAQGLYPMAYYPHNYHFMAATAALEGRADKALDAAVQVAALADTSFYRKPGYETLQHYSTIPLYVMVKFGQWENILNQASPDEDLVYPKAVWHYARGMAFSSQGDKVKANEALDSIKEIAKLDVLNEITIWDLNAVKDLVDIAALMLEANINEKEGNFTEAAEMLAKAVEIEDALTYNEPPDWFFSVRHNLGAVLLKAEKYEEAEKIYLEDLAFYPENGWALNGLYNCLIAQKRPEEAIKVKERFNKAWQYANVQLDDSRIDVLAVKSFKIKQPKSYLVNIPVVAICKSNNG